MRTMCMLAIVMLSAGPAWGQCDSGSDGSDGAFNPQSNVTIDLALAVDASWNTASPVPGRGVYDADQWAVVFKYTTIDIPAGVTVTFNNHPKGAPVIWLASGDVTIAGSVNLDGADGDASVIYALPGPGGFSGGAEYAPSNPASAGFGPGGGRRGIGGAGAVVIHGAGGSYTYGTASIVPLIGGSGGGAGFSSVGSGSGGAGAGAILIASSGDVILGSSGEIHANGGQGLSGTYDGGGGSGGAVRLVANDVSILGTLRALGGTSRRPGGVGRIRVETASGVWVGTTEPMALVGPCGSLFPDGTVPTIRATLVDGSTVPLDPVARVVSGDMNIAAAGSVTLEIEANNVSVDPVGPTVRVRVVFERGDSFTATSTPLVGTFASSTATATITFPGGRSEVQLTLDLP